MSGSPRLLHDNQISEMKSNLEIQRVGLENILFSYSTTSGKKVLNVEAYGVDDILQHDEYYENIEDHLTFAELSWLNPMACELNKKLEINFDATIPVFPDGTMDHSKVKFHISAGLFSRQTEKHQILASVKSLYTSLIPFRQYIKNVTFKWHLYRLKTILFELELDGRKVNSILSNTQVTNQQVLGQWLATLDNIIDSNQGRFKHIVTLPVINGKMSAALIKSGVCFRFSGKNGDQGKGAERCN